jgi:hypothetical protein
VFFTNLIFFISVHWIYSDEGLKAAEAANNNDVTFLAPDDAKPFFDLGPSCKLHIVNDFLLVVETIEFFFVDFAHGGKKSGDSSHLGVLLLVGMEAVAVDRTPNIAQFKKYFKAAFGYGGIVVVFYLCCV